MHRDCNIVLHCAHGSSVDPPGVVSFGSAPPSPLTICTFPVLPQLATSLESGGMYA